MTSMAIRIPGEMKKEMSRLKINWSHYLRQSIREALASEKKREWIKRMQKLLRKTPPAPRGTAAQIIRQMRDHG